MDDKSRDGRLIIYDVEENSCLLGEGQRPEMVYHSDDIDTCLFGTLFPSWIGPIGETPYGERIRNGEYLGEVEEAREISYVHPIAGEDGNPAEVINELYYVNGDDLLTAWFSFHYSLSDGEIAMVVTRRYQYREIVPSASTRPIRTSPGLRRTAEIR